MTGGGQRKQHHYVPRMYLKRFAGDDGHIQVYRLLVSHPAVPLWKSSSVAGVAYHSHLYTRLIAGGESDEVERWLDREFETPAEEAIEKATTNQRLTRKDWRRLVRFLAAQDVRTPTQLIAFITRSKNILPDLIERTLKESVQSIENSDHSIFDDPEASLVDPEALPLRIKIREKPDEACGELRAETIVGRKLWVWQIRHLLTDTIRVLHKHRWTVLHAPDGVEWFTSDDPVVKLNFKVGKYDFRGGWASPKTEILMPLSPQHIMYTQIGGRPPIRGEVVPPKVARMFRRFIAEHSSRLIFAPTPDPGISALRPRCVNAEQYQDERRQWEKWHEEQTKAERELMGQDDD